MSKNSSSLSSSVFRLALVGNPNSGKSSVFNRLTGLHQKVGNFPGITVDKKTGSYTLSNGKTIELTDFPGAYSFYPISEDERIVVQSLIDKQGENYPDAVLFIADYTRLEKHLLLFTQIKDLGLPVALVLNMADMADRKGIEMNIDELSEKLDSPVAVVSSHTGLGFEDIEQLITLLCEQSGDRSLNSEKEKAGEYSDRKIQSPSDANLKDSSFKPFYQLTDQEKRISQELVSEFPDINDYQRVLLLHHFQWLPSLSSRQRNFLQALTAKENFSSLHHQVEETMSRFDAFSPIVHQVLKKPLGERLGNTARIDRVLTNPIIGPFIFFALMTLIFQSIFSWANYPTDAIEWLFGGLTEIVKVVLPTSWLADLITDGLLAGLGGILVFVPQIAILFLLITLLEEIGYMARAAFMFDRLMQFFGLNGRSLVALISSGACAIPAIMSTRTISNRKERLITILVAPFISCSARIPVYVILIGFVVPADKYYGVFNAQGLAFMGLYLLGIAAALGTALFFKFVLKSQEKSFLMLELPEYRTPLARNVGLTVWGKVRSFVVEAGRVILIISVILWALASYGPKAEMAQAEIRAADLALEHNLSEKDASNLVASYQLEASYAGHMGKWIEPAIRPLGFDWKMGIAIISSFAAREVFIGTMATLYSIGSETDEPRIQERLASEVNPLTGEKVYTPATALSLLVFYVFAMMCMGTLAVVKRETKGWKWPVFQFIFMTGLAYLASWGVYAWMS